MFGIKRSFYSKILVSLITFSALLMGHTAVFAQESPNTGIYIDHNNVDLLTGTSQITKSMVSIGSGSDGLSTSMTMSYGVGTQYRNNMLGMINYFPSRGYVVSIGESAEEFTLSGSTYTPKEKPARH